MNNTYYKSCPNCGANLDPGEKCDCGKNEITDHTQLFEELGDVFHQAICDCNPTRTLNVSESLILNFDISEEDGASLAVLKRTGAYKMDIISQFTGCDAKWLYSILTKQALDEETYDLANFTNPMMRS